MDNIITTVAGLLDALGCGAILMHQSGEIVHANQRMCDYAARPRAELLGRRLTELYDDQNDRELIAELLRAAPREREFFVPRPDGTRLAVIFIGQQFPGPPPQSDYRIITLIDISERRRTEERLRQQYEEVSKLSDTVVAQALDLKSYSGVLEERVRERTADLHEANLQAIYMLAVASEARDTDTGERIISNEPFFDVGRAIARSHHEDFNGCGYPDGLAGARIPRAARIVHLADVFDALISRRVYKPAWSPQSALTCIIENRGRQFDPDVVDAFIARYRRRAFDAILTSRTTAANIAPS